ncbi:hypothetical protein VYU27_007192, partial [Nannochloropsis oceanica]
MMVDCQLIPPRVSLEVNDSIVATPKGQEGAEAGVRGTRLF